MGEWHAHPTGHAVPSARDSATYHQFLDDPELGFHSVIAVILTRHEHHWVGAAWAARHDRITPVELRLDGPLG